MMFFSGLHHFKPYFIKQKAAGEYSPTAFFNTGQCHGRRLIYSCTGLPVHIDML